MRASSPIPWATTPTSAPTSSHTLAVSRRVEIPLERLPRCQLEPTEHVGTIFVPPRGIETGTPMAVECFRALDDAEGRVDELRLP